MKLKTAVYAGSFDPITNGHLDIIERSAAIFDNLIIAVFVNPNKEALFSVQERVELIREVTRHLPNAQVESFQGLLSDYARQRGAKAIVRGLRAVSDFEYEFQMALMNKKLNPNVETIFMMSSSKNIYISSSLIKEVSSLGGSISGLVPRVVENLLMEKFARRVKSSK
jgi:pantetheine-phosphate adenylyltransferase